MDAHVLIVLIVITASSAVTRTAQPQHRCTDVASCCVGGCRRCCTRDTNRLGQKNSIFSSSRFGVRVFQRIMWCPAYQSSSATVAHATRLTRLTSPIHCSPTLPNTCVNVDTGDKCRRVSPWRVRRTVLQLHMPQAACVATILVAPGFFLSKRYLQIQSPA